MKSDKNFYSNSGGAWGSPISAWTQNLPLKLAKTLYFFLLTVAGSIFASSWAHGASKADPYYCDIVARIPHATYQQCLGQKIIILEGNSQEMATAHGRIFKEHFSPEVTTYFSEKVDEAVDFLPSFLKSLARYAISSIASGLYEGMPQEYRTNMKQFSKAADLPLSKINKALASADLGSWSYGFWGARSSIPLFGCTSVGMVQDDHLVYGRNLDFEGTDVIDKNSLLVVHKPTTPHELKRAAFVADGIHFSAISAFNEAGVAIFLHQNFASDSSLKGLSIMLLLDWVLKQSRTSEEAIDFLRDHRPGPMWTFVVVDLNRKKITGVEASNSAFGVRNSLSEDHKSLFVQTNHLLTSEAQPKQLISYPLLRNSQIRYDQALRMLSAMPHPTPQKIVDILGYQKEGHIDPSLYDDIAKASTVHTVLLDADGNREPEIWLSRSLAPSSLGSFVKFKFRDLFSKDSALPYEYVAPRAHFSEAYRKQAVLVKAFKASEEEHDFRKALTLVTNFTSPALLVYRATLHYQLKQWPQLEGTLRALDGDETATESLKESGSALRVLGLYRQGRVQQARELAASSLKNKNGAQSHWSSILRKIRDGKGLTEADLEAQFDSFAGNIDTPPQELTILPRELLN